MHEALGSLPSILQKENQGRKGEEMEKSPRKNMQAGSDNSTLKGYVCGSWASHELYIQRHNLWSLVT